MIEVSLKTRRTAAGGPDEALVAAIVRACRDRTKGSLGRTAIQKICYFAQALGIPLSYRFRIYFYGPYSESLASAVDMMLVDGILTDRGSNLGSHSDYWPSPDGESLIKEHEDLVRRHGPDITRVADLFGSLDPQSLEVLSTLHFVDRRLKAAGADHPPRDQVLAEFEHEKAGKFPMDLASQGYDALQRAGLIG